MKTKFLHYTSDDQVVFDEPVTLNAGLKGVATNTVLNKTLKAGENETVNTGHGTFLVNLSWVGNNAIGARTYIYFSYNGYYESVKLADFINFHAGNNVHELTFGDASITLSVTSTYNANGNSFTLSILKLA